MGEKAGLTARQVSLVAGSLPRRVRVKDHTQHVDQQKHSAIPVRERRKGLAEFHGRRRADQARNKTMVFGGS